MVRMEKEDSVVSEWQTVDHALAYLARANAKAVILSMYRREGITRWGSGRPISSLSDITASVETRGKELLIRAERGPGWEGGVFSTRIPSE